MQEQLEEIIRLTPSNVVIVNYTIEQYSNHRNSLFKKGIPFTVSGFTDANADDNLLNKFVELYGHHSLKARFHATPEEYANNRKYIDISLKDYIEDVFHSSHPQTFYAAKSVIDDNILQDLNIENPFPECAENFRSPIVGSGRKDQLLPCTRTARIIFLYKSSVQNGGYCFLSAKSIN
jgi:hypothetical protein